MFIFAHLGIGSKIASPWSRGLPLRWLLLGTLLPDLIDKPVYYGLSLITGRHGSELGLISGTRTFGHTGLLILLIFGIAMIQRSRALAAICLGMATHVLLDCVSEYFLGLQGTGNLAAHAVPQVTAVNALLWPLLGTAFPTFPYHGPIEHLGSVTRFPFLLGAELVGIALLGWEVWKNWHRSEIVAFIYHRRLSIRKERRERRRLTRGLPTDSED